MRLLAISLVLAVAVPAAAGRERSAGPRVRLVTTMGAIVIELEPDRAPRTVANFLAYVREGFYDGTVFHRVVPGFVIQGGGFTASLERKPTHPPIPNEAAASGLANRRGTVAMARTADPDSATSQFYINLRDNPALDPRPGSAGYCVFGRVVEGMDVVDRIGGVRTHVAAALDPATGRRHPMRDVPVEPVVIERAEVVSGG